MTKVDEALERFVIFQFAVEDVAAVTTLSPFDVSVELIGAEEVEIVKTAALETTTTAVPEATTTAAPATEAAITTEEPKQGNKLKLRLSLQTPQPMVVALK